MTRWIAIAAALLLGVAAWVFWTPGAPPVGARVFVSNYRSDTVSVVDVALAREIATLPVGQAPMGLALRAGDAPLLAVANSTASHVTLIDPLALEVRGAVPVGKGPEFVAFSPDGATLYATSHYDRTLTIVDVAQRRAVGDPIAFDRRPGEVVVAPDGGRVYVLLRDPNGAVVAIDAATRQVVGTVPVGKSPTGIGVSADGRRVFAASFDDSTISVVDTATLAVVATLDAPTGLGLLVHPRKPLLYSLASFEDTVAVVDVEAGKAVASIDVGQWPTYGAISADGRLLFVPNEDSDSLAQIDTQTNAVVLRIAVGDEPAHAVIFGAAP